jgi:hypothetical protein
LNASDTSFFTSDNWDSIQTVDSRIIASFIRDQDVPSCEVNEKNGPDEVLFPSSILQLFLNSLFFVTIIVVKAIRLGILRLTSLQKRLIYDLKVICEKCKNPAIVRFNSRLLLCGEFQSHG